MLAFPFASFSDVEVCSFSECSFVSKLCETSTKQTSPPVAVTVFQMANTDDEIDYSHVGFIDCQVKIFETMMCVPNEILIGRYFCVSFCFNLLEAINFSFKLKYNSPTKKNEKLYRKQ